MSIVSCPVCAKGDLAFVAQPTPPDPKTIEVVATCSACQYIFYHHFLLEEMMSDVWTAEELDLNVNDSPRHLTVVKS